MIYQLLFQKTCLRILTKYEMRQLPDEELIKYYWLNEYCFYSVLDLAFFFSPDLKFAKEYVYKFLLYGLATYAYYWSGKQVIMYDFYIFYPHRGRILLGYLPITSWAEFRRAWNFDGILLRLVTAPHLLCRMIQAVMFGVGTGTMFGLGYAFMVSCFYVVAGLKHHK